MKRASAFCGCPFPKGTQMKKLIVLLLAITAVMLAGCSREGGGKDGTMSSSEDSSRVTDTENYVDAENGLTLTSGNSVLELCVKDGRLHITALKAGNSGRNLAAGGECALPECYTRGKSPEADFAWKYESARSCKGENGENGYTVRFTDSAAQAYYDLYITAYPDSEGPFEIFGYLGNTGDDEIEVTPGCWFSAPVTGDSAPTAWTFAKEGWLAQGVTRYDGTLHQGTGLYMTVVSKKKVSTATYITHDVSDSGYLPMMYLDYGDSGLYFAQEWTDCLLTAKPQNGGNGDVLLTSELQRYGEFSTTVNSGERLFFPNLYLGVYDGDVEVGSNTFKRWFLKHKAPESLTENDAEPLTQYDYALITNVKEGVSDYGFEALKLDYGWWFGVKEGNWMTNEGYLKESPNLGIANSISPLKMLTAMAKRNGSTVTLYYLLHDTMLGMDGVPSSVGKNAHHEWFSNVRIPNGKNAAADLGNTECVAFYQKYMADYFNANGITTWRSDFEPICSTSDKANRHKANGSDVQYWCTVGFGDLVDYLYENVDGFRYECCSSGGMQKDLFTATKAVVINCDDSANYQSLHASFYDSSYVFNPCQIQLPMNIFSFEKGSQYYTGTGDADYGMRCAITGAVMISKWAGTGFDAEEKAFISRYVKLYNEKMKPLIKYGDLYHILPRPDGVNWDGLEYVDADTDREIKGLVMLWKPTNTEGETKTVKLRGLKADVSYQLTFEDRPEQNQVMTGAELMETGLTVTIPGEMGSEMVFITESAGK